jgi:two-component system sensor histidine kinase CpxA
VKSLYWRIFLSIGLTMAIVVAASVLIAFRAVSQWTEAMDELEPRLLRAEAQAVLEAEGETGLRRWLRDVEKAYPAIWVRVVAPDGAELLGRDVPQTALRRLAGRRAMGPRRGSPGHGPAQDLTAPDGTRYRLMLLPRQAGPFGILGAPGARWAILVAALLVVAGASFLLARSFSRPVRGLRDVTRSLADGDLAVRTAGSLAGRRDEIGALAREFDHMAERLQHLVESRQELFRNVSHELRTPLTRIQVAAELARRKRVGAGAELDRIVTETEALDQLIDQVMDLTRLDDPGLRLASRPYDLSDLVAEIVAGAEIEAGARNIRLDWRQPGPCPGRGDPVLLRSAIENVLRNAIGFSKAGQAISLRLRRGEQDDEHAELLVADQGPGVPPDEVAHIFDPFYQVDRARSPDQRGKGIGLAIAAGVVHRHGGDIKAINRPEGGLEVRIRLPLEATA